MPCAPLLLLVCLLLPLLLLLLYLCKRLVDSSPYLAFHPCPIEAALGRQYVRTIALAFAVVTFAAEDARSCAAIPRQNDEHAKSRRLIQIQLA